MSEEQKISFNFTCPKGHYNAIKVYDHYLELKEVGWGNFLYVIMSNGQPSNEIYLPCYQCRWDITKERAKQAGDLNWPNSAPHSIESKRGECVCYYDSSSDEEQ